MKGKSQITNHWWKYESPSQVVNSFKSRVQDAGGVVEAEGCLLERVLELKRRGIWDKASAVWLPHGYKEGKLYAVKGGANADLTFSRNGTRTRKGPTHVEQVPYNLLSYSQDFTNAAWTKVSGVTATANVATAPNGTLTADRISGFNSSTGDRVLQTITCSPSSTYRGSIWLKGEGANIGKTVDVTIKRGGTTTSTFVTTQHTLTADWVKISDQLTMASDNIQLSYVLASSSTSPSELLVWGSQVVVGAGEKDYIRTTDRFNVPALDYSSDSSCPALSLEPARTNLLTHSGTLDALTWARLNTVVTSSAVLGVDGLMSGVFVDETGAIGSHTVSQTGAKAASALSYTLTVNAKAGGRDWIIVGFSDGVDVIRKSFNLSTGSVGSTSLTGTWVLNNAEIQPSINGFYKIVITVTSTTRTNINTWIYNATADNTISHAGELGKGLYLCNLQLEQGSYATSYIPTTTATVSRVAGYYSLDNATNLIGQTEGLIYLEGYLNITGGTQRLQLSAVASLTNDSFLIQVTNTGTILVQVVTANITQVAISSSAPITSGGLYKIAVTYRGNYVALFVNGVKQGEDLTVTLPALNVISSAGTGGSLFGAFNIPLLLSKTALTDAQAIALTA